MKNATVIGLAVASMTLIACGSGEGANDSVVIVDDTESDETADTGTVDTETADGGMADAVGDGGDAGDVTEDGGNSPSGFPVLGGADNGDEPVEVTNVVDSRAGLDGPRDAEFNRESPDQLWIVNRNDHSAVVVTDPGTDDQESTKYNGRGSRHFLAKPAALAFGEPGLMATAQQEDEKTQRSTPEDFMGISLWPTDLSVFDAGHSSHMDMLHNSPLASGITWEDENIYWVFDGAHGSISQYDFQDDHDHGGSDHSDGIVRRYLDDELGIEKGVVAHVSLDRETGLLYAADTGNGRIVELDTETGEVGSTIRPNYDGSDQRYVEDAEWRTLVEGSEVGLERPAGLELHDEHVFVTDNATSTVHAFTLEGEPVDSLDLSDDIADDGLQGMDFDPQGRLHVVDSENHEILRIEPSTE